MRNRDRQIDTEFQSEAPLVPFISRPNDEQPREDLRRELDDLRSQLTRIEETLLDMEDN